MPGELSISQKIKQQAFILGFDACGFCKAEEIDKLQQQNLNSWLGNAYHADMQYLANNIDKRSNPTILVENARSIICLALNYYPPERQPETAPQFAYYAYGKDYHEVLKTKLKQLFDYIKSLSPSMEGRYFVDTAPVLERYWAAKAGLGFIGKNTLLIIPQKGSYFFLSEIILNIDLEYDKPLSISCGNCTRCLQACPTKAIEQAHLLNSNKCISYQTIENKNDIDESIIPLLGNRLYGCDICQQVCPWNRFAYPHTTKEFLPNSEFLTIDYSTLENMKVEDYQRIFKGSAVKRAKYEGLIRNYRALTSNQI